MAKKKFKFRLERVRDYRDSLKKEKERELALKNLELRVAEERREEIMQAQEGTILPDTTEMTMAELTLTREYLRYLQVSLEIQRKVVKDATVAVEQAREAYVEKAKDVKILDGLKDRKFEEYKEERRKDERKELEKLTVQRHRLRSQDF